MTSIRDRRESTGKPIREMADGTWFVTNLGLFLKAAFDTCVDVQTGKRAPFNEECCGLPVEVEVTVLRDAR